MERQSERQYRRKVITQWKESAKAIQVASPNKKVLLREARHESLIRLEDAARTIADFENLNTLWDNRDIIEDWRVAKHEELSFNAMNDYELPEYGMVVPAPLNHVWWRKLMSGDFNDIIFDCPHEMHELAASKSVDHLIRSLDESRKEILYYWAIRQWSPQMIAEYRGQTDRNIRKVYGKMIDDIRMGLYVLLYPRYSTGAPLTRAQREFCRGYMRQLDEIKPDGRRNR